VRRRRRDPPRRETGDAPDYRASILAFARRWPFAGYGGQFRQWFRRRPAPYGSFGNGSAMRVSPVGWAWDTVDEVLREAERSAAVSHDHPEGIKGAQAVALGVLLARTGADNAAIRAELARRFGYDLTRTVDEIRPAYRFDVTCQGSVPEAIVCFLGAGGWEEAVRLAVSLGGDADTQACIAGALAEARWGVPAAWPTRCAPACPRSCARSSTRSVRGT
jgi:ADP-ribosylglycohydrolase